MAGEMIRILDGNTFVVCDGRGDIEALATEPTGLFSFDTRFLSTWVLTINGQKLNPLSVDDLHYFESRFFLVPGTGTVYIDAKLSVIRQRAVGYGFHEELTMLNHLDEPVDLDVRIDAASDFADLFEIKDALKKLGTYATAVEDGKLAPRVRTGDLPARDGNLGVGARQRRRARPDVHGPDRAARAAGPRTSMSSPRTPGRAGRTRDRNIGAAGSRRDRTWSGASIAGSRTPRRLESDWEPLRSIYQRCLVDLAALRFSPPVAGGKSLPAAGLPWFMTMFGRDSIFTSLQSLPFAPELAATTLRALGDWQGSRRDDFRDEDPGRILHEMRYGEMAAFEERPHTPYYGSVDATPLYVVLLDEYERWTGDRKLVRDLEYEARAALNWIDEYADLMGNGYISYKRRNEQTGLENQAWKDSWNSIAYSDGRLPDFPRATCELQGYAYDAKMRGARLARLVWKDPEYADRLEAAGSRSQAALQPRFLDPRPRVLRARPRRRRQPGRRARVEHRPPPVERHRRRLEGQGRGRPPDGAAAVLGLGGPDDGGGRGSLQPDRLPPRHGLAVRQLVHRLGPAQLRLQGGGGADRVGHPRRGRRVRRAGCRRRSAATTGR